MKSVRELKRELPLLYKRGKIELRDITYLFGKVREILENKGALKEKYPELNLVCNWCAHAKLSGSKTIYRALLDASKSLSEATNVSAGNNPGDMTNAFVKVAGNVLNFPAVRQGLKAVLEQHSIDSTITNTKKWWDACLSLLLHEISEKPIEFPEKVLEGLDVKSKAYKFYKQVLELPSRENHDKVIGLKIMLEENSPLFEGKNGYVAYFKTLSGVNIVVDLQGKESEDAFVS